MPNLRAAESVPELSEEKAVRLPIIADTIEAPGNGSALGHILHGRQSIIKRHCASINAITANNQSGGTRRIIGKALGNPWEWP